VPVRVVPYAYGDVADVGVQLSLPKVAWRIVAFRPARRCVMTWLGPGEKLEGCTCMEAEGKLGLAPGYYTITYMPDPECPRHAVWRTRAIFAALDGEILTWSQVTGIDECTCGTEWRPNSQEPDKMDICYRAPDIVCPVHRGT
jgi:hypothetical protein